MKEVFFMRHGKTWENVAGILIGQNDPQLSEEAREEIRSIKPYIIQPDIVFSSDLRRASETAQLLFPNHEIVFLPQLREKNGGEFQGKPTSVLRALSESDDDEDDAFTDAGVEPLSSLRARAEQVLKVIREVDAQRVMVVSHGTFINCIINILLPEVQVGRTLNNLHYHKITLDDKGKVIDAELSQEWTSH